MEDRVISLIHNFKIFYSIVRGDFIFMMNDFFPRKNSSEIFRHNQSVLHNIAPRICHGMSIYFNKNIPIFRLSSSTFPLRIFRTFIHSMSFSEMRFASVVLRMSQHFRPIFISNNFILLLRKKTPVSFLKSLETFWHIPSPLCHIFNGE